MCMHNINNLAVHIRHCYTYFAQFRIAGMGLSGWMDASVKVVAQLCFTTFIALSG